jgi:hypothetical protein
MKHGLHFYTCSLSLSLNNASTSLSNDGYLGTLNLKLPRTRCKFWENLSNSTKKKMKIGSHNQFLFMWKPKVGFPSDFHNQPCQLVFTVRIGLRTRLTIWSRFENCPTMVQTIWPFTIIHLHKLSWTFYTYMDLECKVSTFIFHGHNMHIKI